MRAMEAQCDFKLNVLIVGDCNVGKTTLLLRAAEGEFVTQHPPNLDRRATVLDVDDHKSMVVLHDTAGQERFGQLTASVFRHADGIILAYDCTNAESFENMKRNWMEGCEMYTQKCSIVIASTKNDYDADSKVVDVADAKEYAMSKGFALFETSSKTGENVTEMLLHLTRVIEETAPELRKQTANLQLEQEPASASRAKKSKCLV